MSDLGYFIEFDDKPVLDENGKLDVFTNHDVAVAYALTILNHGAAEKVVISAMTSEGETVWEQTLTKDKE